MSQVESGPGEPVDAPQVAPPSPKIRRADLDPEAVKVVRKLLEHGHEAYMVGGCVRDLVLGLKPKDFDVATSATPEEVHRLFRNSRIIGRRFRLVHVFFGNKNIETSTFRTTPLQGDDEALLITRDNEWGTVEDDARRRDFTINGLFYDLEADSIVDFVDGMTDLDARRIRTIGEPKTRFCEDPVRMIRAIKFAARLDFEIAPPAWDALRDSAAEIEKCSRARVLEELYKLLRGGAARRSIEILRASGMFEHLWPAYARALAQADADEPDDRASDRLARAMDALDRWIAASNQTPSNGMLLALVCWPLLADVLEETPLSRLPVVLEERLTEIGASLGVARRDREWASALLSGLQRRPRRRNRSDSAEARDSFLEAALFLGMVVDAQSAGGPQLQTWLSLGTKEDEDAGGPAGTGKRSKRRPRGRGRSSRRAGASAGAARGA